MPDGHLFSRKKGKEKEQEKKRSRLKAWLFNRSPEPSGSGVLHSSACGPNFRPTTANTSAAPFSNAISQSKARETHGHVDVVHPDQDFEPNTAHTPATPPVQKRATINADQENNAEASSTSGDLWEDAFQSLSLEERQQLEILIGFAEEPLNPTPKPVRFSHEGAQMLIEIAEKKQEEYGKQVWRFELRGHVIEPRNFTESIISCLSTAGDIGVQFLPQPANAVWPLIKGILQVPVNANVELSTALMTAETMVRNISLGHFYEEIYLKKTEGELQESLRSALVKLYAACLKLLNHASKQINANTTERLLLALLNRQETQSQVSNLDKSLSELTRVIQICQNKTIVHINDRQTKFLAKFRNFDSFVHQSFIELFQSQDERKLSEILNWISLTKEYDRHAEFGGNRAPETCDWILETEIFQSWANCTSPTLLWLQGTMGTGKTVLTSRVITHLLDESRSQDRDRIVYYYCRLKDEYEDPNNVIRSFLRQLATPAHNSNEISRDIKDLFTNMEKQASQLPIEKCKEQLSRSLSGYRQVTFVIDALDECIQAEIPTLLDTILPLLKTTHPPRIFVSSRPDGYIKRRFANYPTIETDSLSSGVRKDIETFIDHALPDFSYWEAFSPQQRTDIKARLLTKSNGMFQWVYLQIANLKTCEISADILNGIDEMPTELPKAYEHIYKSISQRSVQKMIVDRAFMWVMYSCVPLKGEILLAGVCHSGDANPLYKGIDKDRLLSLCRNLIIFDENAGLWKFSHASVAEYAKSKEEWSLQKSHSYAGRVCLQHLIASYGQSIGDRDLTQLLIQKGASVDRCLHTGRFGSALAAAAGCGNLPIAQLLVRAGASPFHPREYTRNALTAAADNNRFEVAQLLIERSSCIDLPLHIGVYGSALAAAVGIGSFKLTQSLIEKGAEPNLSIQHGCFGSALTAAAYYNNLELAEFLIDKGASVDLSLQIGDYRSALTAAIGRGNLKMAEFLIGRGAYIDLRLQTGRFGSALATAVGCGNFPMAELLIDKGASVDLSLEAGDYGSALAAAAGCGSLKLTRLLIEKGANVNLSLQTGQFGSALAAAASCNNFPIAKLLMENGAFVNQPLETGCFGSALAVAAGYNKLKMVKLLIERGACVNLSLQNGDYGSALAAAEGCGNLEVAQLLRDNGAST
ncbi:ankyrin [Aspergillus japonicus CBS 114.51]|uniref:Ankyrin n=1 Tax=Aspergillus japonicus CBS 114.51 TaxID=1448312 RepID=A0A8T8X281_ASPJA|nr:ankyrin [Aspergillus japonicus CBS 114.51]RAH82034.1 ankyrin [Aspergillus japonicus CBS 114.51]